MASLKRALTLTKEKWDNVELSSQPTTEYVSTIYRRASKSSAAAATAARNNVAHAYNNAAPHVGTARDSVVSTTSSWWSSAASYAKSWGAYASREVLIKATIKRIDGVEGFARLGHSVAVVNGRAYVFGGEKTAGALAGNDMNVIFLSAYEGQDVDYTSMPARPREKGGPVPGARKGHTAVVIGDAICVFGGEVAEDARAEEKEGRVWIFDTTTNSWSYADPAGDAPYPAPRCGHAAAASELPAAKVEFSGTRPEKDILPQQPPDAGEFVPEPPEQGSWGTMFVYGGTAASKVSGAEAAASPEEMFNDAWAFDFASKAWFALPPPPGPARTGASLGFAGTSIWRFGGYDGENYIGGAVDQLDVSGLFSGARGTALGQLERESGLGDWELRQMGVVGPIGRANAAVTDVAVWSGRQYLVLVGGQGRVWQGKGKAPDTGTIAEEGDGSADAEDRSAKILDDIWTYQIPLDHTQKSAVQGAEESLVKGELPTGWAEVEYRYVDGNGDVKEDKDVNSAEHSMLKAFRRRTGFAAGKGSEVEGSSFLVWGGVDGRGTVRSDGYMVTIET